MGSRIRNRTAFNDRQATRRASANGEGRSSRWRHGGKQAACLASPRHCCAGAGSDGALADRPTPRADVGRGHPDGAARDRLSPQGGWHAALAGQVGPDYRRRRSGSSLERSGALITFFDGSELELGADTSLIVQEMAQQGSQTTITIQSVFGATVHRVVTLTDASSSYRVEAGGSVALVRGTVFAHYYDPATGDITVAVSDSEVEFPAPARFCGEASAAPTPRAATPARTPSTPRRRFQHRDQPGREQQPEREPESRPDRRQPGRGRAAGPWRRRR